ncbi:carboxypeptidase [bacterium (Candidatus Blackallbacteria) CG17_big_fil_post_rev_8_21_14_2_50_48_46]|uniref:carboxypeptidase T n=1 Tax=bacterium (Candidatus Blackallbacteria) CG17_big_fil_post_rev_8_21_14_2_50_48_46 TaxID=2014261 RepID=A0A2M7FXS5_9BACT|nr:MAG: carboxypeptidase [bacterium (Candidatus Blackallbacteria) CG18_big_fil_WC_8_21_14_2_50_49_26]PIW14100.1 MAG: carboxypeptidase [bacterium (Candidatus Blackallbacteria) CG17_big_fil_post_rev_8_21_14_2_50_48_46]PIW45830.1 MAG: carboxypeptidase [bacterium (Candidatus Blackallbacteria) CG13_big_fil_rev_8_21_14_2_50_49_14]
MSKQFRTSFRMALASVALMVGCSAQTGLLPLNNTGNPALRANAVNPKQQVLSANFEPSFQNSFMTARPMARTGNTVVKVSYQNNAQVSQLAELGMDIWMVTPKYVLGQVNDAVFQRLQLSRLNFSLISPERGMSAQNTFDPQYHTYDEMLAELKQVAQQYPQISSLHDIGDTWQKVHGEGNRDLWALHITGPGEGSQKPGIVFFGNHHARELVTVEIPLHLIHLLLENYGKDPQITELVNTRDIWIVPMVNPDGHLQAEKGDNWRKNMNANDGNRYRGVDLNRNYGHHWNSGGSSSSPSSDTFMGKAPFSEPETQAVRNFVSAHSNLKIMMSYHSFSNLILWPWGYTKQRVNSPKLVEMGQKLGKMTGYVPEQASDLYVASGITDDFTFGEKGLMSFTTEIGSWGDGFDPPYSRVAQFWNENRDAALYLIDTAGKL